MKHLASTGGRRTRRSAGVFTVAAMASGAVAMAGLLAGTNVAAQAAPRVPAVHYSFKTLNNENDPTFNQLLGINDSGLIAGYFGSGEAGHPNKGYLLKPPYHQSDYRNQNFPHSKQTQVTGLNNKGIEVGFYSKMNTQSGNNDNFGYYFDGHKFHKVNYPAPNPANPPVDQLLGVNDSGTAVGFYVDAKGHSHGYSYSIKTHRYRTVPLNVIGATDVTPTAINDVDSVAGFFTNSHGKTVGFLVRKKSPHLFVLNFPSSDSTMPFGVNKSGEVVGVYTRGSKNFGFTWTRFGGYHTVKDPNGPNQTFVNGINSAGDLVGFYTAANGNTDGFLAKP